MPMMINSEVDAPSLEPFIVYQVWQHEEQVPMYLGTAYISIRNIVSLLDFGGFDLLFPFPFINSTYDQLISYFKVLNLQPSMADLAVTCLGYTILTQQSQFNIIWLSIPCQLSCQALLGVIQKSLVERCAQALGLRPDCQGSKSGGYQRL